MEVPPVSTIRTRKIKLKCSCNGEFRNVILLPEHSFSQLRKRLSMDYGFEVSLKYEDGDGDLIILSSQNDFDDLVTNENTDDTAINIIVTETNHLPILSRREPNKNLSIFPITSRQFKNFENPSPSARSNTATPFDRFPRIESPLSAISNFSRDGQHQSRRNVRWKRGEMLGQGAFGVVYLGLNVETGELMAVKQIAIDEVSTKELSSLENEINLLRSFRHPNIVRYIGTEVTPLALSIFLEYVPGGSLKALIDKFGQLEESVAKSYTRQLLIGLEYLHRHGVVHRDLKGANCLVGNDGVVKLADFGSSKQWRPSNTTADTGQTNGDMKGTTPCWMAPEIIKNHGGDISWKKADVWSLGCTTLEMTTGKPPWSQFNNNVTTLYHIACTDTLPVYPSPASVELITFLNVCLTRDPSKRPDITSLLLHPFVTNMGATFWGANGGVFGGFMLRPSTVSASSAGEWDSMGSWRTDGRRSAANAAAAILAPGSAEYPKRLLSAESGMFLSPLGTRAPLSLSHNMRQCNSGSEGDEFQPEIVPEGVKSLSRVLVVNSFREEPRVDTFLERDRVDSLVLSTENLKSHRLSDSALEFSNDDFDSESVVSYQTTHAKSGKNGIETIQKRGGNIPLGTTTFAAGSVNPLLNSNAAKRAAKSIRDITVSKGIEAAARLREREREKERERDRDRNFMQRVKNGKLKKLKCSVEMDRGLQSVTLPSADSEKEMKKSGKDGRESKRVLESGIKEERSIQVGNIPQLSAKIVIPLVVSMTPPRAKVPLAVLPLTILAPDDFPEKDLVLEVQRKSADAFIPYDAIDCVDEISVHSRMTSDNDHVNSSDEEIFSEEDFEADEDAVATGVSTEREREGFPVFKDPTYLNTGGHSHTAPTMSSHCSPNLKCRSSYSASGSSSPVPGPHFLGTSALGGRSVGGSPIHSRNAFYPGSPTLTFTPKASGIGAGSARKGKDGKVTGSGGMPTPDENSVRWAREGSRTHSHNISPARSLSSKKKDIDLSSDFAAAIKTSLLIPPDENDVFPPSSSMATGYVTVNKKSFGANNSRSTVQPHNSKSNNTDKHQSTIRRSMCQGESKNNSPKGGREKDRRESKDHMGIGPDHSPERNMMILCTQNKSLSQLHSGPNSNMSSTRPRNLRERDREREKEKEKERDKERERVRDKEKERDKDRGRDKEMDREAKNMRGSAEFTSAADPGPIMESLRINGTVASVSPIRTRVSIQVCGDERESEKEDRYRVQMEMEREGEDKDEEKEIEEEIEKDGKDGKLAVYESDANDDDCSVASTSISQSNVFLHPIEKTFCKLGKCDDGDEEGDGGEEKGEGVNLLLAPMVLGEHAAAVTCLKNPKRSNLLVSSSLDGTIRVWGKDDKESTMILDCAHFTPDEAKGKDRRRDADTEFLPESHPIVKVTTLWAQALCESVWGACSDGAVRVWGAEGKPLRLLKGHEDNVTAIEGLDPFGSPQHMSSSCLVATGSVDRTVRVWDARSKKSQVFMFRGHTDTILTVRWGGDDDGREDGGRTLVSTGKDKTIRIWDMRAGRLRAVLEKHFGSVSCLRFLPLSGKGANKDKVASFISAGRDSILNTWNSSCECVGSQPGHRGAVNFLSEFNVNLDLRISSMKSSACGLPMMLSAGADNIVKLWDMRKFKCVSEVQVGAASGPLTKAVWVGQSIVTASGGNIRLWDYRTDPYPYPESNEVRHVCLKPDGSPLSEWQSRGLGSHAQPCTDLISTEHFLASSSKSGQIYRWSRERGKE